MKIKISLSLILLLIFALFSYLYKTVPQYSGEHKLRILSSEVKVYRDKFGIPHIEAENSKDLYRAFGYVMAQDRLFQMDLLRRIGNGSLSEVLGKTTLETDILLRSLRLKTSIEETWNKNVSSFDPKLVESFQYFLDGVHAFIEEDNLPLEFILLGYKPKKFSIPDVLSVSGYMALSFAEGLLSDILFSDLANIFPSEIVQQMSQRHKTDDYFIQREVDKNSVSLGPLLKKINNFHSFARDYLGLFHGSNSWVLSGEKSKSGFPILANDPHIAFSNPSVWYEAHLKSPDYEIYGHFIPLMPFPAMGHNDKKAWAVTRSEMDDLDLYEEKLNEEKTQVMFKKEWVDLKVEKAIIKVKGQEDKELNILISPHGPILDDTQFGVDGKHIALKWSYHHPKNFVANTFYRLSHLEDVNKLPWALEGGASPGLNISWVDKKGNIAWKVHGKIPKRVGFRGNHILKGWTGENEYQDYLTIEENPGVINPSEGMIVTANYYPQWEALDKFDGYWQPGERIERIHQLLNTKDKWNVEELKEVQNDQHLLSYKKILKSILNSLEGNEYRGVSAKAYELLKNWKGESGKESLGSSIFHQTIYEIGQATIKTHLGSERFITFNKAADYWHFFKWFINQEKHLFWDNKDTKDVEGKKQAIELAFARGVKNLLKNMVKILINGSGEIYIR
ncbi:penicillin acylase family protein [Bacteriovoracaceae bacterium]|nr:penicillin acylase family protein [Bacteriovoracaceae bacterium]